jgi:hypothetical protein
MGLVLIIKKSTPGWADPGMGSGAKIIFLMDFYRCLWWSHQCKGQYKTYNGKY